MDGRMENIKQIDDTPSDGGSEQKPTGWENMDINANDHHENTSNIPESDKTTWDNIGEKVPFQPKSNTEEHSSLDESKYEKDKERISETFLDYDNILKIVFEASEEGMDFDFECSNNDEYLSRKIVENLRDISSISPTEDEDIWRYSIRDTIFIDVSRSTGDIQSVNKLTSFELRSLAQGKENGVPFSREKLTDFRPKTDLHTHFAGAITPDSLIEVGKKHNISYPAEYLTKAGVDVSQYRVDENGNIELSSVNDDDLDALKARLMISPVTQETFNKMEDVYALRGPFTKNKELFPDLLHSLAETYRDTGVEYAELSYSSFIGDREYMEMINQNVPEIEAETGVKLRFVAGLWRHSDKEWNMDDTDRIIGIARSPYIVGVDFMGHETNSTETFKDELQALANYTMSEDPDFTIRVHAGENPMFKDNVKDTLRIIYDEHKAREEADGQKYSMPRVRIGHGLYGVDEETIQLAKEMGAIIEFNISSNLALNNINSIAEIPIKKYLDAGVDVVLGTDGGGLYSTVGEQEALLATAAGLEPEDFEKMRQTEAKILAKATEREMSHPRLDDVNPLYDNVVYSTPDGQPRYSRAVSERYAAEKAEAARQLDERLEKIGIITNSEEVEKATDGKTPVMITGASKSNWPNITPEDQRNIALTMQVLADVLNPDTAFIVTGGTNFGVEKTMHEAVHRRNESNPDNPMVLLGTLTMEATHEESGGVEPDTITHATILEHDGRKAENWMDLPDTQLEYVKDRDGYMIAVGGGGVVNDMIQRGYNLDVDMQLMDGPYGASTNKSRSLAGNDYSFKTAEDLVRRLYAKNPAMFIDGFSINKISNFIQQAKKEIITLEGI